MKYTAQKIAENLIKTALGEAYHGNDLYVARDFACVTDNDRQCLNRWLHGSNGKGDSIRLQEIAHQIMETKA
jgi:hypothetical protein